MKRYRYEVVVRCAGTFELDDEEAAEYDVDDLAEYATEVAIALLDTRDVEDVTVDEVSLV